MLCGGLGKMSKSKAGQGGSDYGPRLGDDTILHDGKADQGKTDVDMLDRYFAEALWEVAKILDFGAKKYSAGGWATVPNGIKRYQAAARRHKLQRNMGEERDSESELYHWAHQICSELMAFSLYLEQKDETK